jgi:hypothetical protein
MAAKRKTKVKASYSAKGGTKRRGRSTARGAGRPADMFIVQVKEGQYWNDLGSFKNQNQILNLINNKMKSGDIETLADVRVLRGSLLNVGPQLINLGLRGITRTKATTKARGGRTRATTPAVHAQA